ncbi:MAG: pyruvate kinase [Pseudomonadota bacterium]
MTRPRATRIVATLGPATMKPGVLEELLEAGVDVCRINGSHSTPESIRATTAAVRAAAAVVGRHVAVLLDLQGPKIRTGPAAAPVPVAAGEVFSLVMDPDLPASPGRFGTTWPDLVHDLHPGARVLFADGALEAVVVEVLPAAAPPEVRLRAVNGGALGAHKGINVPGLALAAPCLTAKDLEDLAAGVAAGVDWVALSFVRRAADIDTLRVELRRLGAADIPVCAKIEKPQALDEIDGILARVEAIMVARGDLGVEIPLEQVPIAQKRLIRAANLAGVLVITATQMLESMMEAPRPTRAEATDVVNAILDGTDAIMLSGETAAGRFPLEAVAAMVRLAEAAEGSAFLHLPPLEDLPAIPDVGSTVARAACFAVRERPRPLVVFTWSGFSAIVASKSRPPCALFALTPRADTAHKLALAWGVTPLLVPEIAGDGAAMIAAAERALLERGLVREGDEVVILTGRTHERGSTNTLTVERVRA